MKTIDEISRMTLEELETVAADERIPVPEELAGRVAGAVRTPKTARIRTFRWAVPAAAALAILIGVGVSVPREPVPKDTFDDPYLAYAEVEKAFGKISGAVSYGASKVSETEEVIDKIVYWK